MSINIKKNELWEWPPSFRAECVLLFVYLLGKELNIYRVRQTRYVIVSMLTWIVEHWGNIRSFKDSYGQGHDLVKQMYCRRDTQQQQREPRTSCISQGSLWVIRGLTLSLPLTINFNTIVNMTFITVMICI